MKSAGCRRCDRGAGNGEQGCTRRGEERRFLWPGVAGRCGALRTRVNVASVAKRKRAPVGEQEGADGPSRQLCQWGGILENGDSQTGVHKPLGTHESCFGGLYNNM